MLRITRTDQPGYLVSLRVEGRIVGAAVETLERECRPLLGQESGVRLDLAGVGLVDQAGLAALRALRRAGFLIEGCSPLLQEVLDDGDPR